MLDHVGFQVIANQVRVPPVVVQQALHPIGSGIARLLRQLPAVLPLHEAQQSSQVVQNPPARLGTPEPPRDALMHLFDALSPPGDLSHLIPVPCHSLTSPPVDCPNSSRFQSATVVLRVDVLERADGELMIRYQGEAVDFQDGPPPSSALWGADSGCSPGPELQEATGGVVHSHLNAAQRERLSTLESTGEAATEGRSGKGKPVRHQLHRTPTSTQQAHWEAVQLAREQ